MVFDAMVGLACGVQVWEIVSTIMALVGDLDILLCIYLYIYTLTYVYIYIKYIYIHVCVYTHPGICTYIQCISEGPRTLNPRKFHIASSSHGFCRIESSVA